MRQFLYCEFIDWSQLVIVWILIIDPKQTLNTLITYNFGNNVYKLYKMVQKIFNLITILCL